MLSIVRYAEGMQVVLPEQALPARLALNPELQMSDDEFFAFCVANPDVDFERTAEGEIIIVPPAGMESDHRSAEVVIQLGIWARRHSGKVFGSSVKFILPTGAALSPDAAWVSGGRLAKISKEQKRKFPRLCPEFVVEVMSPSDRLPAAMKKMQEWLRGGVDLGWLIHGDERAIYIYRAGQAEPEVRSGVGTVAGEGPVAGFELDLAGIWAGL